VYSCFHDDVKEMEYKDPLTNVSTQVDHERDIEKWGSKYGHPQCVFCTHMYCYSLDRVECHMDPTMNKTSTDKERTVRVCSVRKHNTWTTSNSLYDSLGRNTC
jgi:hypothetical protein